MQGVSREVQAGAHRMAMFGIITILLGMAAIAAPALTGLSIVMSVGVLVILGGILRIMWAFGAGSFGKEALAFAIGALTLLCGVTLVTDPLFASGFLTVLIAAYLYVDGVVEIIGAFRLPAGSGRLWLSISGIASLVLGTMIWRQFPLSGAWAIGVLLGLKLLFSGIVMVAVGVAVRKLAKRADAGSRTP